MMNGEKIAERNLSFVKDNFPAFVAELSSFIHIPSVSAGNKHGKDVVDCAKWMAAHLQGIGLENVQLIATKKHPVVYADWLHADNKPTLLLYGHYDVQPVDPENEWTDDPFSGAVSNGYIYGRGASDDKGQLFAHVKALDSFLKQYGRIPINIKCIFEGEEETGSAGLKELTQRIPSLFNADVCVVSDMSMPSPQQPAITCSLRGMLCLELKLSGQQQDLHSGTFGGAIHNPAQALCEMIASLHNKDGKIAIPDFYTGINQKTTAERIYLQKNGRDDATILKEAGATTGWGEKGYSLYERIAFRPSLSVNGITTGYQGEGPKAIIPAAATAKLSFRLVEGQDPDHIEALFRQHIHAIAPPGISCRIKRLASAKPVVIKPGNSYIQKAATAFRKIFQRPVKFTGSGGTIPIVNLLYEKLQVPVVMMGFALPDDNPHAPNERFLLSNFLHGIETSMAFMRELAGSEW